MIPKMMDFYKPFVDLAPQIWTLSPQGMLMVNVRTELSDAESLTRQCLRSSNMAVKYPLPLYGHDKLSITFHYSV